MPNLTAPQRPPIIVRPSAKTRGSTRASAATRPTRMAVRTRRRPAGTPWRWIGLGGAGLVALLLAVGFATGMNRVVADTLTQAVANVERGVLGWTAQAGLAVDSVQVFGRVETAETDLLAALNAGRGTPVLGVDIAAARMRIEALPWVKAAIIERRLPDTMVVRLQERVPMAVWQQDNRLRVIDADGVVLTEETARFASLPQIVGPDAPEAAPALLDKLNAVPELRAEVVALVRVGGRRWNLRLKSGIDINLPERDEARALGQLSEFEKVSKLLERDVVAIDLRLPDRMLVRTSASAAQRMRLPVPKPTSM
jgi:cell division protein FtsQ